ncbi:MAG: sugar ABC transporter permease [Lachnospiraceae bacterium]|nr:sugar ABC transporter permease [Lachnospiraceae bacterium]MBQ7863096.1 sugar ABC transporter permease [Lachnospiraceae bacterium]
MKRRSKYEGLQKRKAIAGYLFILPFIIGFLAFMVKPFFQSLYMSFCDVQVGPGGFTNVFWGLKNFVEAFTVDLTFTRLLTEELTRMAINVPAIIVFSFFAALLLNQEFKGRAFVRGVFFLPVILSSGVILGVEYDNPIMAQMRDVIEMEGATGVSITDTIKEVLNVSGVGNSVFKVVFDIIDRIYDVVLASGIQIIIFLSGLQTISKSMYEAASIEGCTSWESLWKITFPMISPLLLVNLVYTIVDFCMRTDNQVIKKIQDIMLAKLSYGPASAMAWIYFGIVMAIIGLTSLILSKVVYYYD